MKRAGVLAVLFLGLLSCSKDNPITFHIDSISSESLDNGGPEPVAVGSSVYARAYMLRLNWNCRIVSGKPEGGEYDYYYPDRKADSVAILSLSDFDSLHPAGTALNHLFIPQMSFYSSMKGFHKHLNSGWMDFPSSKDLRLMYAPDSSQVFRFVTWLHFENGDVLTDTTQSLLLTL